MAKYLDSLIISIGDKKGNHSDVNIDQHPDTCPVCEHGIEPLWIDAYGSFTTQKGYSIQSVYLCPRDLCGAVFVVYYSSVQGYKPWRDHDHVFMRSYHLPYFEKKESHAEEIRKISPKFIRIFDQAKMADDIGLDEICGTGYRKALEFLVKDFVIFTDTKCKKEVEEHSLGWVIAHKVKSKRIKMTAKLAKDKGNDETHYIKKMEGLSLEDLKKLIRLTTNWVVDVILTEGYETKINKKTPDKP